MKHPILAAAVLTCHALPAANTPAEIFQMNCAACHMVDQMLVGPSLVEISGLYRNDPDGFVKWCIKPEHKREGLVEMPSMAHLGEPVLRQLHGYVIASAAGRTELKKSGGDPYAVPSAMLRRPRIQRIFLPDASPAAIAVALPGDLSFCFDASVCRLRYVWQGGFIEGGPYWRANGSSLAQPDGRVVYREAAFPFPAPADREPATEFLGYRVAQDGIPTFRYRRDGMAWEETIRPAAGGQGIERHFTTPGDRSLEVLAPEGIGISSSTGSLSIPADRSRSFTLTYRWK